MQINFDYFNAYLLNNQIFCNTFIKQIKWFNKIFFLQNKNKKSNNLILKKSFLLFLFYFIILFLSNVVKAFASDAHKHWHSERGFDIPGGLFKNKLKL